MRRRLFPIWACLLTLAIWAGNALLWPESARGQAPPPIVQPPPMFQQPGQQPTGPAERVAPPLDPRQLGLDIPAVGIVTPGAGRRVIVPDESGDPVVAQVHCNVGLTSLVILPSGRLKVVPKARAIDTERPFAPLKGEDLVSRVQAGGYQDFKTATSEHYSFIYSCNDHFFETTRDILDSLYGGVVDSLTKWGLPVKPPQTPLVVMIFKDRESFDAFNKMPPQMLAYYSLVNNFVILYEDPELSDAAPEYALKRASYTIAHEGVHQILHNVGVQQRLAPWPAWLTEGLPELFCPVRVTSSMVKEGASSLPTRSVRWTRLGLVNDLRMFDLLKMRPDKGALIEKTVNAKGLDADGYAIAWGLAHFLSGSGQAKQFQSFLRDMAAIEPLANFDDPEYAAPQELFKKYWGDDYAKLETSVTKHLNSEGVKSSYRDPMVYQTHYLVVHTALKGKAAKVTVMITTSPDGARKWRDEEEKKQKPGMKHAFRTQVCETQKKAEAVLATLVRK